MPFPPTPFNVDAVQVHRIDVLFDELAELTGQRNAIDAKIVDIVAEIDHDGIWGNTGCRSVAALVAWRTGVSPRNAEILTAVAHRRDEFPLLTAGLREGRLSLDQVGVIAENAADGSDAHYADLAAVATVEQLRTAVKQEPKPEPKPKPEPTPSIRKRDTGEHTTYTITLPKLDAAKFDAALDGTRDGLINDWKRDREQAGIPDEPEYPDAYAAALARAARTDSPAAMPTTADAFMHLIEAGWDTEVAARPHGQHTTVIVHLDIEQKTAALHLGSLLTDAERRYLLCDATCEAWFEKNGHPIGAGRATRTVNRRLRRALEHRDHGTCVVPGCASTRGLHAHHLVHWEDGGPTELDNLVLLCPYHHRMHHRGQITLTGPAAELVVTDHRGRTLTNASLARPPENPPPDVAPYKGPTGERAQWWWYTPFEPNPPPTDN